MPMINTSINQQDDIPGLTPKEMSEYRGLINPTETTLSEHETRQASIQVQAERFQELLDATNLQIENFRTDNNIGNDINLEDYAEYGELKRRAEGLEKARDDTLAQKQREEVREQQEGDITRLQKFKEWAKENMVGLSALSISVAGIITTIIIGARKAIVAGAQATSKFGKAIADLGKKLWPLLGPVLTLVGTAISLGARGLLWLASNLWVLALAFAWFIYDQYKQKKNITYIYMNRLEDELKSGFRRSVKTSIEKGDRKSHLITLNPNTVNPDEELYIDIPKLKESSCLVPGSLHLVFDIKVTGTKTHFMNNLSKQLQKRLQIRLAGDTVYDCHGESLISTYKDLWLTKSRRLDMIEYGIANANTRKLISNDDTGASSGDDQKKSDALVYAIYGTKQRIQVDYILRDHGLYSPHDMNNNFRYIVTFPKASDILVAQKNQTLGTYTLENLQLEYETIDHLEIANDVSSTYAVGRNLSYEHWTLMQTSVGGASTTLVNENINIPRKSMKAIVLLFTKETKVDSEEFVYPNIDKINVTIEGVPNSVYNQGISKTKFYEEAKRVLGSNEIDQNMDFAKFYKDKFALVIDLRSHMEQLKTGHGKKIVNTQNGVLLEINKRAHTGNLNCHIFVFSDGLVKFANNNIHSIQ